MGTIPSRHLDKRPGRSNPSDRSNRSEDTSSTQNTEPAWLNYFTAHNFHFVDHTIGEETPEVNESTSATNIEEGEKPESNVDIPKPASEEAAPEPPKESGSEEAPKDESNVASGDTIIETPKLKPLVIRGLDFNRKENEEKHQTDDYDPEELRTFMVVRRGDEFNITLDLDRPFDEEKDEVRIIFEMDNYIKKTGHRPKANNGTLVTCHMKKGLNDRFWCCKLAEVGENQITVTVKSSINSLIGRWTMFAQTSFFEIPDGEEKKTFHRYRHFGKLYVIFNPFHKDDAVYMENEVERDEYVMADTGHVFVGNARQPWARPWSFGQFDEDVLDCAMFLLDLSGISYKVRNNPVYIARALSAVTNQSDDNGVLVGNWSGNYEGGESPTSWSGSVKIIQQFFESKQPVQFGQCWVFSGVLTTFGRALGMPTRSVTNFSSAHDTDESATIDTFWTEDGEKDEWRTNDSVWNFHVWNETWMRRDDLPDGYNGWQAFDSTPQEASDGIFQAGPAPVIAIKEGIVDMRYDTQFIFSEVNADRVNWKLIDGEWCVASTTRNSIGMKISTNLPRKINRPVNPWAPSAEKYRLDVTRDYKYQEGTAEERAAVRRAYSKARAPHEGVYDSATKDVSFVVDMEDGQMLGSNFDVIVKVQNHSRDKRTVKMRVTLKTVYYTGVQKAIVKSKKFQLELDSVASTDAELRIMFEEYTYKLTPEAAFRVEIDASVVETRQCHCSEEDFRLRRPDVEIIGPKSVKEGEEFEILAKFASTMPIHLTECSWEVEAPKCGKPIKEDEMNLEPYDRRERKFQLTARRAKKDKKRTVVVTFISKEMHDVVGEHEFTVIRKDKDTDSDEE